MPKQEQTVKPNLFIGSSRESMKYARAVHAQLKYNTQVTPWYAGAFQVNESTMDALERNLDRSDYAVFIMAPDDVVLIRGKYCFISRDNTLFELGLFWGKLRRNRVFCILPEQVKEREDLITDVKIDEYHLLSDLQGLTLLQYEWRDDDNFQGAVDVACGEIIARIEEHGYYVNPSQLLVKRGEDLKRKQGLLHFFLEYNKHSTSTKEEEKFLILSEAIRNSFLTPYQYRVTGAAVWKARGDEGIAQIAGNVGKGIFFPFHANEGKLEGKPHILVVEAFLKREWNYYRMGKQVAPYYLLCYPFGQHYVLTVHIAGDEDLTEDILWHIREDNAELLDTINYLVGGDWE